MVSLLHQPSCLAFHISATDAAPLQIHSRVPHEEKQRTEHLDLGSGASSDTLSSHLIGQNSIS